MKINSTAAKHIKKYCYIIGLLSFLIAFFACSQMLRYQEKEKKASGTYMAQSTIRRVKAKLDNYIMIFWEIISLMDRIWMKTLFQNWQKRFLMRKVW